MRYFIFLFFVSVAMAQTPAGGKWMLTTVTDKMTDVKTEQFLLYADSAIEDLGLKLVPVLSIACNGSGRFNGVVLQTGVVLALPSDPTSHLYDLRVRLDSKISTQFWDRYEDGKTLGLGNRGLFNKHYLNGILKAGDVRFQLPTFSGYQVVAKFSPAGLDRQILARSCGLKL